MKLISIDEYLETLHPDLLWWTQRVISYMKEKHSDHPIVFYYQRPTLKLNQHLFIMLGGGKKHFSLYTTDFDYVEKHRLLNLPKITYGKSAILFPLNKKEMIDLAYQVIDEVVVRS